ncbi:hypothetical protein [Streptomyces chiangmaiensis]|uniref:Uncharacterized protein n=1 Tax=Streptomyces chiangmaiensis TaxID=766497 RepID=A0ABU7F9P4_9ACTN|nr:hypothetical protein [Streptomyces chiangmaiensis]MED7820917.1 hypothetical protein [Streptomyces chiangmaiensis]
MFIAPLSTPDSSQATLDAFRPARRLSAGSGVLTLLTGFALGRRGEARATSW